MSNQFGANQNPPWVRQDFGNQSTGATMLQPSVTYPFTQAQQTQFAPQQLGGPGGNMQAAPSGGLLPQPGIALPTSLAAVTVAQVNPVSYPVKSQAGTGNPVPNVKQRMFTGSVTKMHDTFGFVDEEVFFQVSCIKGMIPKVGDRVLVEASYNANMPFKWNATRVISLHDSMGNNQVMSMQQQQQQQQQQHQQHQQQQQQLKAIQQQALGLMGAAPLINTSTPMLGATGSMAGGQGLLSNPPGPPPLMTGLSKFQSGGVFNSNRSSVNTGPGLLGDPRPRSLLGPIKDHRGSGGPSSMSGIGGGMGNSDSQKDRDRRERDRRDRRAEIRRKRSRSPAASKRSHSPPPARPRSPVKRRPTRPAPRYVVQVPKILLDVKEATVMSLKGKYSNLYVPSDFFHTSFSWVDNFPLTRPFSLGQACSFHIMHKDVPPIEEADCALEPNDADYLFSAKVMLLASLSKEELYDKSCCLAENLPDALDTAQHPTRLMQFLVGTRGKNEPMAIGGPWSPSLDGPNPQANPQVLIKTAIRTTKALTGIDLSSCTQWYRFTEIRYFRPESKHKDRMQPARVETVVIFLPDVWNCNPTHLEWTSLQAAYSKHLQLKLYPETAAMQQEEEEEAETEASEDKSEPSHFSTLDPKIMKVGDLRKELELRNISAKGLKSQLIARLLKSLRAEEDLEKESKEKEAVEAAATEAAKAIEDDKEKERKKEDEEKSETKSKEDEEIQRKEKREKALLERRYKLPDSPSVIIHPSPTAKGGKFDCTVMSLSVLLDYRPEDNKEHSFEVSLFAELFNEMLMRDFGFQIYSAIALAPPKKEEEKKSEDGKKEEKKEKEDKDKKDQDKKDDKKSSTEAQSPKRRKVEDKEDVEEAVKEGSESGSKDDDADDKDEEHKSDKDKEEKKKKKEEERKKTVNPHLLLAFSYFDQNHCGYLTDKDVEDIIHTLGLKLSRAQIKKLVQKVIHRENFKYRKLTDRPVDEKDKAIEEEVDGTAPKLEPEQLARGNRESLRKLLELSGAKADPEPSVPAQENDESGKFVSYKGGLLDIESLMQKLERSEKSRAALEKSLMDCTDELKSVKSSFAESESGSNKLSQELIKVKADWETEKTTRMSAETLNNEWHRLASDSKTHMMNALNCMNSMLTSEDKKERSGHDRRSDGKKNSVKKESSRETETKVNIKSELGTDSKTKSK